MVRSQWLKESLGEWAKGPLHPVIFIQSAAGLGAGVGSAEGSRL